MSLLWETSLRQGMCRGQGSSLRQGRCSRLDSRLGNQETHPVVWRAGWMLLQPAAQEHWLAGRPAHTMQTALQESIKFIKVQP